MGKIDFGLNCRKSCLLGLVDWLDWRGMLQLSWKGFDLAGLG